MIVFVATKPLQIMTSIVVARQVAPHRSRLVVVPNFADGEHVVERLACHEMGFERVESAPNRFAAILSQRAEDVARVFVDSDVGLKTPAAMLLLRALRPRVRFSLYEEGIGLIDPRLSIRPPAAYQRLGIATNLGESRMIDDVWTYTPDALGDRIAPGRLRVIDLALGDFVRAERALLHEVFWRDFEDDTRAWGGALCRLYLSSWRVDPRALELLASSPGYRVFKPHPHIRHDVAQAYGLDQVLSATIPAELVIGALASAFDTVEVWHHRSSVTHYVQAPNVRYMEIGEALASAPTSERTAAPVPR